MAQIISSNLLAASVAGVLLTDGLNTGGAVPSIVLGMAANLCFRIYGTGKTAMDLTGIVSWEYHVAHDYVTVIESLLCSKVRLTVRIGNLIKIRT